MTRTFDGRPVDPALLDELVDLAARAPSAGKTQGWHLVVLEGPRTALFWDATLPVERRAAFAFPGLLAAPTIAIPVAEPDAYVARYGEGDKAATGLGSGPDAWPVPYWTVDASMAVMTFLLAAEEAGLGALFFGVFHGEGAVRAALGIDARDQVIGAIALGWPAPDPRPGRSAGRARRAVAERLRRP
jgi:nitroreductase